MALSCVVRAVARAHRTSLVSCCRRAHTLQHKGRLYTKKHEWVSVDGGIGTVGISDYAQEALGEVVFAQLPEVGKEIRAGEECGALESVKAAGEVYSPVSGLVTEKNDAVESSPALINKDCYSEGWLFRVKLSTPEELQQLMDQTSYDSYLKDLH
ncbi:glycine cleavage system H protein-like [Colias croceus]|uniref:glycine cleavage system H protein-like n=1 Tax=Colias crocea TaxID=72248 RepID=UPI001E27AF2F|nr:glycine cleavage system H protein-like [Colias croceus]